MRFVFFFLLFERTIIEEEGDHISMSILFMLSRYSLFIELLMKTRFGFIFIS